VFINTTLLFIVVLFFVSPTYLFSNELVNDVIRGKLITGELPAKYLKYNGIVLNENTLMDVNRQFGKTNIFKQSEISSPYSLCYINKNNLKYGMLFDAGPLGGWNIITSIHIGKLPVKIAKNCIRVENLKYDITKSYIGMKREQFTLLFKGESSFSNANEIEYNYICDLNKCGNGVKGLITKKLTGIYAHFTKSNLDYYRIYHINSD